MHVQGPVPLDDPAYANRDFEIRLVREVQAGKWVLLLGPRQHGKTSAFLRLRKTLSEHATSTALVDLQRVPPFDSYAQLVTWFAKQVASAVQQPAGIAETDDLSTALGQALPGGNAPVVILVDEASSIKNDEWRNSFYGQLRAISSERGTAKDGDIAKRLRFVFAGTFRPERLVAEANSPFNICERIETGDLSRDHISTLATDAGLETAEEAAALIHDAVGGQPYLNQRLILAGLGADNPLDAIAQELERLREGDSDHIANLYRRVASDDALVALVSSVVDTGKIATEAGNEDQRYLIVMGLLRREKGFLYFRNKLYAEVAALSPQFAKVARAEAKRAVLFSLDLDAFGSVASAQLKEIAHSAQHGAVGAYRSGCNRLALAGFGTAMEAVLIDFLLRQSPGDLQTAAAACKNKNRFFDDKDPATWTLVDLMRGSRTLLGLGDVDIPENLREWRNLIHPGAALKDYKPDEELAPEVCVATAQLRIVLRDLP
jgi:AAA-like domain